MADPSPRGVGAEPVSVTSFGRCLAGCLVVGAVVVPAPATAQGTPPPDTTVVSDVLPEQEELPDSLAVDTVYVVMPEVGRPVPAGWNTGVWEWDRVDLLDTEALTLEELFRKIPGLLRIRDGDYGSSRAGVGFGLTGRHIRLFRDGIEVPALDGGIPEFSRISVTGLERVRIVRTPFAIRVDLESLIPPEPRPYSVVDAGTGDLQTNFFRGTFGDPDALKGGLGFSIDRIDSAGSNGAENGAVMGTSVRYVFSPSDRWGISFGFHSISNRINREELQEDISRSDLHLVGRVRLTDDVTLDGFFSRSSISDTTTVPEDLTAMDTVPFILDRTRNEFGVRAHIERSGFWGRGELRRGSGTPGLPETVFEATGGVSRDRFGGASVHWLSEDWADGSGSSIEARVWSRSLYGLRAFASYGTGERGTPFLEVPVVDSDDPPDPMEEDPMDDGPVVLPDPVFRTLFTDRTASRAGVEFERWGLRLSGAVLNVESDSIPPLGVGLDRGASIQPGGDRTGWEADVSVPLLLLDGLSAQGSYQSWDEGLSYLPTKIYDARLAFHDVFLPSGNLEVWGEFGARGRGEMQVPIIPDPEADEPTGFAVVPSSLEWYGRIQVRVISFRLWIGWENFTSREIEDRPGRLLPPARVLYGIRWILWN